MKNIPIDLLRALVTVVDLKGYTKAGKQLGRTQPAISLQLKRLQDGLGVPLFEKGDGAIRLTEHGELVANYARRMLALNDELLLRLSPRQAKGKLRIGLPNDYADHFLPRFLASLDQTGREMAFDVHCDVSVNLLAALRDDQFDIVIAMTADGPDEGAFMTWREPVTWVGRPGSRQPSDETIRLVAYPEGCQYRRAMMTALQREGRAFEIVYTSPSLSSIEAAVTSGFGITALAARVVPRTLSPIRALPRLPSLTDVVVGVYMREERADRNLRTIAARFAELFVDSLPDQS